MEQLKKATLQDLETITSYYKNVNFHLSPYTKFWKQLWFEYADINWAIIHNCLVIRQCWSDEPQKDAYWEIPISLNGNEKDEIEAIKWIFDYCHQHEIKPEFRHIPAHKMNLIASAFMGICEYIVERDYSEYIYDATEFKNATGSKFARVRNFIKLFKKNYANYSFSELNKDNLNEAVEFAKQWWINHNTVSNHFWANESANAEVNFIKNFDFKKYVGLILKVDNQVVGLSLGEIQNDILYVVIEKSLHSIRGIDAFLSNEFAKRYTNENIKYISRCDDEGIPGLRKSKLQYHPTEIVKTITVFPHTYLKSLVNKIPTIKTPNKGLILKDISPNDTNYLWLCIDEVNNQYYDYNWKPDFYANHRQDEKPDIHWFLNQRKEWLKNEWEMSWGIYNEHNVLVGEVCLHNFSFRNDCEVGVRILPQFHHQGYAYEAVKEAICFCYYELGVDLVKIKAYKENTNSINLIKKLNASKVNQDDKYIYFEILPSNL